MALRLMLPPALRRWVFAWACFSLCCLFACQRPSQIKPPEAKDGVLDLRTWDFREQGEVPLKGAWKFSWQTLASVPPASDASGTMRVPAHWQGQNHPQQAGQTLDGLGYGTYSLKVLLPPTFSQQKIGVLVPEVYSAQRLLARQGDRVLVDLSQGVLGTQEGDEIPQNRPTVERILPTDSAEIDIVWQISNFHHSRGGGRRAPILGIEQDLRDQFIKERIQAAVLIGILLIMALYHFSLVLQRSEDKASLWFGICLFSLAIRQVTNSQIVETYFPTPHTGLHETLSRLRYFTFYFAYPCLLTFIAYLTPGLWLSRLQKFFWAVTGIFILTTLVLPLQKYSPYSLYYPYVQGGICLTAIIHLAFAAWQGNRDARLSLIGTGIYATATVHDILIGLGFFVNEYLTSYASVVFVFSQSYILADRFAKTYRDNERYAQELIEKEKARTIFFHNTSHELRTPLNGMIGFMQFLAAGRYGALPEAAQEQIQKCIRLALSLKNQVNTILDLAKSKKGTLALQNSLVDLQDLAAEAKDLAAGLLLKGPLLSFAYKESIDESSRRFITDRGKLATIIRNLLGNAFKFADPLRENHVVLQLSRQDAGLELIVSDSGIGIAQDQQGKVFEEFQQLAGDARRSYEGTGLGLAMVRDLVALMKGTIELTSTLGQGSRFRVWIPEQSDIHQTQDVPLVSEIQMPAAAPKPLLPAPASVEAPKGHILVVDDNEVNCEVLSELLGQGDYQVTVAMSGEEALKRARTQHPDLILLDMMMPHMSGEDVLKIVQADPEIKDIPIILITARASDDDRVFGLSLGADDYLAKPIHHEELLFRVKNILYRRYLIAQVSAWEERERFVHLGRLIQDLGHELKNIFTADHLEPGMSERGAQRVLEHLPIAAPSFPAFVTALIQEKYLDSNLMTLDMLVFPSPETKRNRSLRSLRSTLAQLDLGEPQKREIWTAILNLDPGQWQTCDETLLIITSYLTMRQQNRIAIEVVMSILDYSRDTSLIDTCDPVLVLDRVRKLLQRRLILHKIELDMQLETIQLPMQAVHLMQIMINLFNNACDALQNEPVTERWIQVRVIQDGEGWHLHFRNGGAPIPQAIAENLFRQAVSSKKDQGYGLGLGISRRLAQRYQGSLELRREAAHPEFVLTLPHERVPSLAKGA